MSGNLDGTLFQGDRELAAGWHEFVPDRPDDRLVLFWAWHGKEDILPSSRQIGYDLLGSKEVCPSVSNTLLAREPDLHDIDSLSRFERHRECSRVTRYFFLASHCL